jgi:hypothetical protein
MLFKSLALFGTVEVPGLDGSRTISAWAAEIETCQDVQHDLIPRCGLFVGLVEKRAGKRLSIARCAIFRVLASGQISLPALPGPAFKIGAKVNAETYRQTDRKAGWPKI